MTSRLARTIYLDNASTTPLDPRVLKAMVPFLKSEFGNPGSIHALGVEAKKTLENARKTVARVLSLHPDDIVFTSSGTESNNLAILGFFRAFQKKGKKLSKLHAVTSVIEHSSVLEVFRVLEREGLQVTYLPVSGDGVVDLALLKKLLKQETVFVSIMYANNEIGTVQPIREIAKVLRQHANVSGKTRAKPVFHVDASQAPLYLDMQVDRLGADLITLDGQKMYGPKGVGVLIVRHGVELQPLIYGGGQERGLRSGTEHIPGIVGFARALEIAVSEREKEISRLTILRDYFIKKILTLFPHAVLNGSPTLRLPGNINISIPETDTEFLTLQLDAEGVLVSTKSSCMRDSEDSYVVRALGGKKFRAAHSLRISLGRFTTKKDIDTTLAILRKKKNITSKNS